MCSDYEDRKKEDSDQARQSGHEKKYQDTYDRPEKDYIQKVEAPNPWPDPPPTRPDKTPDKA